MSRYRLLYLLLCSVLLPVFGGVVRRGSNADPRPGPVGERPYEMAGRVEDRVPQATFEDCTQWEVETSQAEASLYRTQEQRLFRPYCGKLVFRGTGASPKIWVRLKRPVTITKDWDCVNFWNWGNSWAWHHRADMPPLLVSALVEGADGKRHELFLGAMNYEYWFLSHKKLQGRIARPAKFIGFQFTNGTNKKDGTVYLGPVYFYKEPLKPLTFEPWPEKLPFPVGKHGILPSNKVSDFRNSVRHSATETVFSYAGKDCQLSFRYRPLTGTLGDVAVLYQGRETYPCKGGGIQFGGVAPDSGKIGRRLLSQRLEGDVLSAVWRLSCGGRSVTVSYRLRMRQKSLIVEMEEGSGAVECVELGHAEPVETGKLFWVPYLTFGGKNRDPRVLYADGLFYFTQFDWFVSDASILIGRHGLKDGSAVFNGGARYDCLTDGKRNPMKERLFITVSPDFAEVLPTIPNPPSAMKEVQRERQWRIKGGSDIRHEIWEAQRLRALGMEKVAIRYHESSWRDGGESFTFRLNAAPKRGGDKALRHLISSVQACDWLVGVYTNYTDYAPVNSHWNEDWVSRTPSGEWQTAWARCYAPKPMIAVQMEARLAPQLKKKFGMNHSYCDVHTAVTPFQRTDFDARVPEAGKFRRTFECFGRLLYNEKIAYGGPVYSEGNNHWWYAGLTDGNYAQLTSPNPPDEDLLVDFDLLKMHPLQMDSGMGAQYMFFGKRKDRNYLQYVASTLAYGHIGMLDGNPSQMMKMYYMLQPLQKHYVMVPVRRIAYARGTELLDTSQALITDAYREGRVHVEYEGGMKVWVNGGDKAWKLGEQAPVDAELPAWGYLATAPQGDTFSYSGMVRAGGLRETYGPKRFIDLAHSPSSHYLDTRGDFVNAGTMAGQGAAVLRVERRNNAGWELIPAREFSCMGFDPALTGTKGNLTVTAVDDKGKSLGPATVRWSRGLLYVLRKDTKAFKYVMKPSNQAIPPQIGCEASRYAIPGEDITVAMPGAWTLEGGKVFWCSPKGEIPMEPQRQGGTLRVRVPGGLPLNALVWLRIPSRFQTQAEATPLWLDFLTVPAYDVELQAQRDCVPQGERIPLRVTVGSNLKRPGGGVLTLTSTAGKLDRSQFTLAVPACGQQSFEVALAMPQNQSEVMLNGAIMENGQRGTLKTRLTVTLEHELKLDLTRLAWQGGHCRRGKPEQMGFDDGYDGGFRAQFGVSGGVSKNAIFSHPPWGDKGTGYVFGKATIQLPPEPTLMQWYLGRNDGTYVGDGLIFSVAVIADGKERVLGTFHHAAFAWKPVSVDLSAYAGRKVTLKLMADCGPKDDSTADHGTWGEPRIVSKRKLMRVRIASGE